MSGVGLPGFWSRVDAEADCWTWTGKQHTRGYGVYQWTKTGYALAHRYAWTHLVGPIDATTTLDHLCKNRLCVNPDHLEPVSRAENTRRGWRYRTSHCRRGHAYDDANTYTTPDSARRCRACNRQNKSTYRTRKAA